jgi:hypothetical protein
MATARLDSAGGGEFSAKFKRVALISFISYDSDGVIKKTEPKGC